MALPPAANHLHHSKINVRKSTNINLETFSSSWVAFSKIVKRKSFTEDKLNKTVKCWILLRELGVAPCMASEPPYWYNLGYIFSHLNVCFILGSIWFYQRNGVQIWKINSMTLSLESSWFKSISSWKSFLSIINMLERRRKNHFSIHRGPSVFSAELLWIRYFNFYYSSINL